MNKAKNIVLGSTDDNMSVVASTDVTRHSWSIYSFIFQSVTANCTLCYT